MFGWMDGLMLAIGMRRLDIPAVSRAPLPMDDAEVSALRASDAKALFLQDWMAMADERLAIVDARLGITAGTG